MSIHYRDREYFQSHKKKPDPSEFLETLRPHFREYEITRIGNIAGLDRIGVPVVTAVRPNSPTISINSGKGLTLDAAKVSGAMEALEVAIAERAVLPSFRAKYSDLAGRIGQIPIENLCLTDGSIFHPELAFDWTPVWDIVNQTNVAAPLEMVSMEVTGNVGSYTNSRKLPWSMLLAFQIGTNGLASGATFLDAVYHGITEVIERDAWSCSRYAFEKHGVKPRRVDLSTIEDSDTKTLLGKIDSAGVSVFLFDVTTDIDVPAYGAMIVDREVPDSGVFLGYGCHLNPPIAMIRAITEACQSRCCYIAGARDDMYRRQFMVTRKQQDAMVIFDEVPPSVDARERVDQSTDSVHGDIELIISKLQKAGLNQVLLADLSTPSVPISVVRVIVPGLEGYMFENYTPGYRAKTHQDRCIPRPVAAD
jgi:ribosomal protein S12 methylthiotransferase accessory factor